MKYYHVNYISNNTLRTMISMRDICMEIVQATKYSYICYFYVELTPSQGTRHQNIFCKKRNKITSSEKAQMLNEPTGDIENLTVCEFIL